MALDFRKFSKGLRILPTDALVTSPNVQKGDLQVDNASGELVYNDGSDNSVIITEKNTTTLENKTLKDPVINTITGESTEDLKIESGSGQNVVLTNSTNTADLTVGFNGGIDIFGSSEVQISAGASHDISLLSDVDLSFNIIKNLTNPISAQDAATKDYVDSKVEDQIVNGETSKAPSQNAVFDSLSTKLNLSGGTLTGDITFSPGYGIVTAADGAAGSLSKVVVLNSSPYTPPSNVRMLIVELIGGGGGGGGVNGPGSPVTQTYIGGAGGGGGYHLFMLKGFVPGVAPTFTFTIGAGGSGGGGGTIPPGPGYPGGTTSLTLQSNAPYYSATTFSATGGSGGSSASAGGGGTSNNVSGGIASAVVSPLYTEIKRLNGPIGGGSLLTLDVTNATLVSGVLTLTKKYKTHFAYGNSPLQSLGGYNLGYYAEASTSFSGNAGTIPGQGGSGAAALQSVATPTGGAGAPGRITIWEYV